MAKNVQLTARQRNLAESLARRGIAETHIAQQVGASYAVTRKYLCSLRASGLLGTTYAERRRSILERDTAARELRAQGLGYEEIAGELGTSMSSVARACKGTGRAGPRKRAAGERRQEAVLLARQGLTTAQIASELRARPHTIRKDLRAATNTDWTNDRRMARAQRVAQAEALHAAGRTLDDIAKDLGLQITTVRGYLRGKGSTIAGAARRKTASARRARAQELADTGVSRAAIAKDLGVSEATVSWYFRTAGPRVKKTLRDTLAQRRRKVAVEQRDQGATAQDIARATGTTSPSSLLKGAPATPRSAYRRGKIRHRP